MTAKLTLRDARAIRARRASGESVESLARAYHVGTTTIREIIKGLRFSEKTALESLMQTFTHKPQNPESYRERILHFKQLAPLEKEEFQALSPDDQFAYLCSRAMLLADV